MKKGKNFVLLGISLIISVIIFSSMISALTADVQVNEDPWYTWKKNSSFGGANLTGFYAPLPVFFEGWASSPRDDIVNYRWNFGDGNILEGAGMFNSAHVYEIPGSYTATLTITDSSGATSSDSILISVWARTGNIYYVDSAIWRDLHENRTDKFRPLGEWAFELFRKILFNAVPPLK